MSGGGCCNSINYTAEAENYLSENAHFCKSTLSPFTYLDKRAFLLTDALFVLRYVIQIRGKL